MQIRQKYGVFGLYRLVNKTSMFYKEKLKSIDEISENASLGTKFHSFDNNVFVDKTKKYR